MWQWFTTYSIWILVIAGLVVFILLLFSDRVRNFISMLDSILEIQNRIENLAQRIREFLGETGIDKTWRQGCNSTRGGTGCSSPAT